MCPGAAPASGRTAAEEVDEAVSVKSSLRFARCAIGVRNGAGAGAGNGERMTNGALALAGKRAGGSAGGGPGSVFGGCSGSEGGPAPSEDRAGSSRPSDECARGCSFDEADLVSELGAELFIRCWCFSALGFVRPLLANEPCGDSKLSLISSEREAVMVNFEHLQSRQLKFDIY